MISKILFHIYAVVALSLFGLFIYNDVSYKLAMFGVGKAQALAIIALAQRLLGA